MTELYLSPYFSLEEVKMPVDYVQKNLLIYYNSIDIEEMII